MDIGRAIYKILKDNTAVFSMVENKISPNVMNQTTEFPFIVYDVMSTDPTSQKDSVATLDVVTIMISAYSDNYKDSSKLANYIITALDRVSGNYNGVEIQAIDFEGYDDVFDDDSGSDGIYRKSLDFSVRIINDINNIYSLDFDGVDDYVNLGVTGMSAAKNTGSISAWIKLNTVSASGNIFRMQVDANNSIFVFYHAGDNELRAVYKAGGTTNLAVTTDAIEGDGLWHHVASTWNHTGNVVLYLDGVAKQTTAISGTFTGSIGSANIGANTTGGGFWNGKIDEVGLYNAELTSDNVKDIYNEGFPKGQGGTSLIGWWKMGDGDDNGTVIATYPTIVDVTGNNNGTMTNMASGDILPDVPEG